MESKNPSNRIHPLVAAAAVSVMLVSLIGVAAITGILPNSNSTGTPWKASDARLDSSFKSGTAFVTEPKATQSGPAKTAPKPVVQAQRSTPAPRPAAAHKAPLQRVAQARPICHSCGRIESIQALQQAAEPSGVGVAAGAILGGVLGNQVGGGNGKTLATIAGAVGGGYAGNQIEKRTRHTTSYQMRVRMQDGTVRNVPQAGQNGWQVGDRVRVVNGTLTAEG